MTIPPNAGLNDLSRAIKFYESLPLDQLTDDEKTHLVQLKAAKEKAIKGKVSQMTSQVIKDIVNRME